MNPWMWTWVLVLVALLVLVVLSRWYATDHHDDDDKE